MRVRIYTCGMYYNNKKKNKNNNNNNNNNRYVYISMRIILMIFILIYTHAQSERCCLRTGEALAPAGYGCSGGLY